MATATTIEQRLANLEREVAEIRGVLKKDAEAKNWVDQVLGSMEEYPDFDEVLRLGREFRQSSPSDVDH